MRTKRKLYPLYTAPKTTTIPYILIITTIMIFNTACLQTAIIAQNPTDPAPTQATMLQTSEPESGAVYEIPTQGQQQTCAIVTAEKALHLRQSPDEKSRVITWLQAGTNVLVIGKVGAWWKVESAVGTGYAKAKYLQESECE